MLGTHLIFTCYGFWLPNDPRGSGSSSVRAQHLYEIGGGATKVTTRHSIAHHQHNHALRIATKKALTRPPVVLNGIQARAVARGIALIADKLDLTIYAFAIMPDHAHAVVAPHRLTGDKLIAALKRAGTRQLNDEGIHPLASLPRSNGKAPSPWGGSGWKVFLDTPEAMHQAIAYVEQNPEKAGLKRQQWSFVTPYKESR